MWMVSISIGNKGALLKACYDVTLAGDEDDVAMSEREEFQALPLASSASEFLDRYAALSRLLNERVAPIVGPLVTPGGAGDEAASAFISTIEGERRTGSTHAMTALHTRFGPLPQGVEHAVDVCWAMNSPQLFHRLVGLCGWTPEQYEAFVAAQLKAALL